MGILGSQIIKEILKVLLPLWLALGLLLFILEWLAQVFNVKTDAGTALLLYFYKLPSHLQLVYPVAVLFTVLVVLGAMNRSREVVAAQSMGYSGWSLMWPTAVAVLAAGVLHFAVTAYVAPWGMRKHYELYDTAVLKVPPRYSQIRQEKIWYRNQDVLYNVRYFDPEKRELFDVTIYTFDDDFHIAQTINARKAAWNGTNWILSDGSINLVDKRLETPVSQNFERRSTRLLDDPRNMTRIEMTADVASQPELHSLIRRYEALGINTARLEVVFHSRMSFVLIPFIFLLLAFPKTLQFRRSHAGVGRDGVFVTAVCMIYWLIFNFGVNMGNTGKLQPAVAAWAPTLLLLAIVIVYNRTRSLRTSSA
jgi:lipopolysaccharide export system permease protein